MGQKDPYACSGLPDVISEILWVKTYVAAFLRNFPAVFNTRCNSDLPSDHKVDVESILLAKSYMSSPLKFFLCTEGLTKTRPGCSSGRTRQCGCR